MTTSSAFPLQGDSSAVPMEATMDSNGFPQTASPVTSTWDGLDVSPLRDLSQRVLFQALDAITDEPRSLFLDPALAGALGLVTDVTSLKQHGVERMFWLEEPKMEDGAGRKSHADGETKRARSTGAKTIPVPISAPTRSIVYICRPETKWMHVIAGHILADKASSPVNATASQLMHSYTILFAPRRTELCLTILAGSSSLSGTSNGAANGNGTASSTNYPSVLPYVTIMDFGLEFVPLAQDVLSLELKKSWKQIYEEGDHTSIYYAAQALMTMQHAFGLFPRILGKGDLAKRLCDLLLRQRREHITFDPNHPALTRPSTSIDSLILIDRSVDLASPLSTQLTYEGLLDELLGIESAHVEVVDWSPSQLPGNARGASSVPATPGLASGSTTPKLDTSSSAAGSSSAAAASATVAGAKRQKKHHLDATSDRIHAAIRDDNFAVVGMRLHEMAKKLNSEYDARHSARTVPQMRAFVGRLGGLEQDRSNLAIHTALAQSIMRETTSERFARALEVEQNLVAGVDVQEQLAPIEEMINMEMPLRIVIRLLCLASVVSGGLKAKSIDFFKREIVQTYGFEYMPLLIKLDMLGLFTKATPASSRANVGFAGVRRSLKLINDDVDEHNPRDISYVFSGYAPLSVRLVQTIAQKEAFIDAARRQFASPIQAAFSNAQVAPSDRPKAHPIIGWRGFEDVIATLPGATVDEVQTGSAGGANKNGVRSTGATASAGSTTTDPDHITTTIVFFIGGITYAEIAALRFMSRQSRNRRFLICTTQTIHGTGMIADLAGEHVSIPRV